MIHNIPKLTQKWHRPIHILHPGQDPLSDPAQITQLYNNIPSKNKKRTYLPNSHHLIFQDTDNKQAIQQLIHFLKHTQTTQKP